MKKRFQIIYIQLIICMFCWSCGNKHDFPQITHFPFKSDRSSNWGLIGIDGKILFEDEFKETISFVSEGIFIARDSDDKLQYYTASKKPKLISNELYTRGGYCSESLIPVVKENEHISYIDKSGKDIFKLEQYEGKDIIAVNAYFSNQLAAFMTMDGKIGYINIKGETVIKPVYDIAYPFSEGIAVVSENDRWHAINTKGEKIFELKEKEAKIFLYSDGLLVGDRNVYDKKGEIVFRIPAKIKYISSFKDGFACFIDETNSVGIIDNKGTISLRAKYDMSYRNQNGKVLVGKKKDTKYNIDLIETNGTKLKTYNDLSCFYALSDKYNVVQENDEYYFIDKEGKMVSPNSYSMINCLPYSSDIFPENSLFLTQVGLASWVYSDYFNPISAVESVLSELNQYGIGKIKLGESINKFSKIYDLSSTSNYDYWFNCKGKVGLYGLQTSYSVGFNKGIKDWYGDYNNDAIINHIIINIDTEEMFYSKAEKKVKDAIETYMTILNFKRVSEETSNWYNDDWYIYTSKDYPYLLGINTKGTKIVLEKS